MRQLTPYDFFTLKLVDDNPGVSIRALHDEVNQLLIDRGVLPEYATPKTSKTSTESSIRRLRAAGLITPNVLVAMPAAQLLWMKIGLRWTHWPWYIPIAHGQPDYSNIKER